MELKNDRYVLPRKEIIEKETYTKVTNLNATKSITNTRTFNHTKILSVNEEVCFSQPCCTFMHARFMNIANPGYY